MIERSFYQTFHSFVKHLTQFFGSLHPIYSENLCLLNSWKTTRCPTRYWYRRYLSKIWPLGLLLRLVWQLPIKYHLSAIKVRSKGYFVTLKARPTWALRFYQYLIYFQISRYFLIDRLTTNLRFAQASLESLESGSKMNFKIKSLKFHHSPHDLSSTFWWKIQMSRNEQCLTSASPQNRFVENFTFLAKMENRREVNQDFHCQKAHRPPNSQNPHHFKLWSEGS